MNEKQKRVYELLKQIHFESNLEHPDDSDNAQWSIYRVLSLMVKDTSFNDINDEDFIPALEAFTKELEIKEKELNEVFEDKEFDNFRDLKNFLNDLDDKYLDVEFGSEVGGAPLSFYAYGGSDGKVNLLYGH